MCAGGGAWLQGAVLRRPRPGGRQLGRASARRPRTGPRRADAPRDGHRQRVGRRNTVPGPAGIDGQAPAGVVGRDPARRSGRARPGGYGRPRRDQGGREPSDVVLRQHRRPGEDRRTLLRQRSLVPHRRRRNPGRGRLLPRSATTRSSRNCGTRSSTGSPHTLTHAPSGKIQRFAPRERRRQEFPVTGPLSRTRYQEIDSMPVSRLPPRRGGGPARPDAESFPRKGFRTPGRCGSSPCHARPSSATGRPCRLRFEPPEYLEQQTVLKQPVPRAPLRPRRHPGSPSPAPTGWRRDAP